MAAPLRRVELHADLDAMTERMRHINVGLPSGWPIGLEQDLLRRKFGGMRLPDTPIRSAVGARILFIGSPRRGHLLDRPPSELAARGLWEPAAAGRWDRDDLLCAVERLGKNPRLRTGPARTSPFASGHILEYAAPDQVASRLERLLARMNAAEPKLHPLLHAIAIYFETLLIHPFPNGNGRLARLLFQLSLHRTIGLKAPVFPLGPACAHNRPALIAAYLAWEFDRNAQPLVDFITAALTSLVDLYERTSLKPGPPPSPPAPA